VKIQGFKFYQAGQLPEAHQAFSHACNLNPTDAESWMMLGVISARLGALPQAIAQLQRATQILPGSAPAWSNLGLALLNANQLQEAEACLRRAIELDPNDAGSYNTLGALYRQQGKVDAAIHAYQEAIRRQPRDANAHSNLGGILQEQCRTDDAIAAYRRALKIAPRFAQAEFNLGTALQGSGQHEQALYHFRKALQLEPGLVDATAAIASLQEKEGHFDEAMNTIAPLIKGAATPAQAAVTYADVARRTGAAVRAIELLDAVSRRTDLSNVDRQEIEYALGNLLDQQGDYDGAFGHYHRANNIRPHHFDCAAQERQLRQIMERFPVGSLPPVNATSDQYPPAIFIVGMPRSSTSLVEQILASHPEVHGGGELPYMGSLLAQYSHDIRTLGQRYLKQLRALNPKARFITDKMPHNFLHLGLIAQAIPGVRIIHTQRNALDTCLSIYFHNFNANHPYATSLADLGHYYRHYEMLMAHWREVLGTQLLDLPYEALLADQEGMTRRLLDHCGLEWHPGCLAFHETKRIVNTPSYDQVRRPMYKSSRERWRNYEKHLAPLIDALETTASSGP
jgi:tetratricopeptide (TPR) repeat protein